MKKPKNIKIKKVSRTEGLNYLLPVLRKLDKLGIPYYLGEKYGIGDKYIVIKIPTFLKIND